MAERVDFAALVERARGLVTASGDRVILGIAGPPGAGKSTLAERLVAALDDAVLVPMDGYHLAGVQLEELGRSARKGAPDTFDAGGYAAMLARLRSCTDADVYAPIFDRGLEEPIAGAIRVTPEVRIVVTEGNYLLLDDFGWSDVAGFLDESWYLEPPALVRVDRLVSRRESFGHDHAAAVDWVAAVDEPNAALVAGTRERATLVVDAG